MTKFINIIRLLAIASPLVYLFILLVFLLAVMMWTMGIPFVYSLQASLISWVFFSIVVAFFIADRGKT